jgi:hypothetical protein
MARKKLDKAPDEALKAKRELFCRYYTQNQELFGNATMAYAEAYGYELDALSKEGVYEEIENEDGTTDHGKLLEESEYDKACNVCAVEASRLLRNPKIQDRITVLLNELLKDEVVDSQLAKLVTQDRDNPTKIAAIREYNKLRGRIIDRTKIITERFDKDDLRALLSPLPAERQDELYATITNAIAEAELLRSGAEIQSDSA